VETLIKRLRTGDQAEWERIVEEDGFVPWSSWSSRTGSNSGGPQSVLYTLPRIKPLQRSDGGSYEPGVLSSFTRRIVSYPNTPRDAQGRSVGFQLALDAFCVNLPYF
jgi:hypothetical protein